MSQNIIAGEDVAAAEFNKLLVTHLQVLRQQALSLTRNKADAEDLMQSTVASALGARESFCPGTDFKAWVTRIQRNRFLSNIRQRRFHVDLADVPETMLGRSGGQEEQLQLKELKHHLARLPDDQRKILLMISVDGMSYEAASAELGVPVGTLKCRVFRARAQLQAWLSRQMPQARQTAKPARAKPTPAPATMPGQAPAAEMIMAAEPSLAAPSPALGAAMAGEKPPRKFVMPLAPETAIPAYLAARQPTGSPLERAIPAAA